MKRIERALISVYDKTGVVEFAKGLADLKVEILSTGGTARLLTANGVRVIEVSDFTGFPEMLDGRVKTLHPRIAAGILAVRENPEHMRQIDEHNLSLIDLICVNLYPFVETTQKPGVQFEEVIENIDIGGPSMLRAAAKNFQNVAVVTLPADYSSVLATLQSSEGALPPRILFDLACKAFVCTAQYDGQIAQYLSRVAPAKFPLQTPPADEFPARVFMDFEKIQDLRYGENPHQRACFYGWGDQPRHGLAAARQIQGKELSYNNIADLDAAWSLSREFVQPACCIIKHANPCGTAIGATLKEAYLRAYGADTVSAFGSIIALNRVVDRDTAIELAKLFVEAIVAPDYESAALEILAAKKNLRVLSLNDSGATRNWAAFEMKRVEGGMLIQDVNSALFSPERRVVTLRQPTEQEAVDLDFVWRVTKHVKSNAIVLARGGCTLGVGAGQMSRVDSVRISVQKAQEAAKGAALGSDAYFPFRDGIDEAARAGVTAIIQPGGSIRDAEVIEAANEHGMAMVFAGMRHFRH